MPSFFNLFTAHAAWHPISVSPEMGERGDKRTTAFYAVFLLNPFPKTQITATEQLLAKTLISVSYTACV
jgi:hypothetical protein